MDFKTLNGVWKLKRFCMDCTELIFKGPVKLIQWVKIENSSFIFTVCVKSVPLYHFKLACVVLQMAVKEFFKRRFNWSLLMESF